MLKNHPVEVIDDVDLDNRSSYNNDQIIDNDIKLLEDAFNAQMDALNSVTAWAQNDTWTPFITSIQALKGKMVPEEDSEKINIINSFLSEVRKKTLERYKEFMGIMPDSNAFGTFEDLESTEVQEVLTAFYGFFITYRSEGIVNYVYNMVNDNFKNIIATYKPLVNRQDLGAKNERKKIKNLDKAVVLDKIDDIVKDILRGTITCEEDFVTEVTKNFEDEWHNAVVIDTLDGIALPKLREAFFGDIFSEEKADVLRNVIMNVYAKLSEKYKETT